MRTRTARKTNDLSAVGTITCTSGSPMVPTFLYNPPISDIGSIQAALAESSREVLLANCRVLHSIEKILGRIDRRLAKLEGLNLK